MARFFWSSQAGRGAFRLEFSNVVFLVRGACAHKVGPHRSLIASAQFGLLILQFSVLGCQRGVLKVAFLAWLAHHDVLNLPLWMIWRSQYRTLSLR
jgi:hypothetical protein